MSSTAKTGSSYAWAILIACIAFYAVPVGIIGNTAGIFITPVMNEFGWSRTDATLFMTIQPLTAALFTPLAGRIIKKYNPRWILTASSLVFGLASLSCAFFTEVWQWHLYGFVYGVTAAFYMYIAVPTMVNRWFKKNNGLAIGLAGAMISILAAFMSPIGQGWITEFGWQNARIIMGIIATCISVVVTAALLRKDPESMGKLPWGYSEADEIAAKTAAEAPKEGATMKQAQRSPALYMLMLVAGFFVMGAAFFQQIPSYAATTDLGAAAGAFAVTIVMVGGIIGKFALGWICDFLGAKVAGLLSGLLGCIGIGMAFFAGSNLVMFYIGVGMFGVGYSGLSTVPPMLASQGFGTANFTQIYAWVATVLNIFSAAAAFIYAQIFDRTGSFDAAFYLVMGIFAVVAVFSLLIIPIAKKSWQNKAA